jgi:primosomal protein N' (replication factor Y) (superfamily II helicase)
MSANCQVNRAPAWFFFSFWGPDWTSCNILSDLCQKRKCLLLILYLYRMSSRVDYFVDVVLPLSLPNLYTYRIPQSLNGMVLPGMRVLVQFGKNKLYAAIVWRIHETTPNYTARFIDSVLDPEPVVNEKQLQLWEWISEYYLCHKGEVMLAALPSGLRLSSETRIELNQAWEGKREDLDDQSFSLCEALDVRKTLSVEDVSAILDRKTVYPLIRRLLDEGLLRVYEEVQEKYRPKFETYVRLAADYEDEDKLRIVFDKLEKKAYKQLEILMALIRLSDHYGKERKLVKKNDLLKAANADSAAINGLLRKKVIEAEDLEVSRLLFAEGNKSAPVLSAHQEKALDTIQLCFETRTVCLLHGVTSSGKTEVYIRLIADQLEKQKQVLYLLPEIALTTQLIVRLQKHFGEKTLIYHSKFNENERVEVWKEVLKGKPVVVIGARSAVFLPFVSLGLVVIDEEHDPSYKQQEPAPRYSARETAIWLARLHEAKTLLGSATPSVETYHHAKQERYGLAELHERFGGSILPEITVVDLREAMKKRQMKTSFSALLVEKTEAALAAGEQVIFFQNRRGFSPAIECQSCAHVPHCVRCDVSLTYHKHNHQLRCHYCGWNTNTPSQCEACGSTELKMRGVGTERIEEELSLLFPHAKVARMDLDTTRGKYSLQKLVNDFESKRLDILVGTQMVTKGLDFGHVSLVGILHADQLMNFPDFRAYERSFQLMAQVAGRAGRRAKQGEVIIQTFNPEHPVVKAVIANDYFSVYHNELAERMQFHYPPFHRLIRLTLKTKDQVLLDNGAQFLTDQLRQHFGSRILGPEFPPVGKVRDEFLKNIMIKIEREANSSKVKEVLMTLINQFRVHPDFKKVRVITDVDPA